MERILISKEWDRDYPFYTFKPKGYVDNFCERTSAMVGIAFDKRRGRWTAPAGDASVAYLQRTFGNDCLIWRSGAGGASGDRGGNRTYAPARKPAERKSGQKNRQPKGPPVELPGHWQLALHRTEEQLKVRRYSWRTVKSYLNHLRQFFAAHQSLILPQITSEVIRTYIVARAEQGNYAEATQNQLLNGIKFWLEQVEGREKAFIDLRPKKKQQLPNVLSMEEVGKLFKATTNLKHRCILMTIYSAGLRLSEVCNLRIQDIHSDRGQIFFHAGKGKKDRYTTLSQSLLVELRLYFVEYQPKYWLFEGQTGGEYSVRSVQAILRKAVDKSKINSYATVHTLRHSYATHLLEGGTSLRHIQELLGHASSRTTEIYMHVSNEESARIVSPLDRLKKE
ncbi:tyrosine-type recombinase/integrase [Neolewinella persica]|uniref:tyrosine-type recombinase/integrase n=1 Tax=Neolewinella persica TaxID=70998 RepID=UPI000378F808|nr:tyrosine-type recombinase/integrase [Neolewinella persica]